MYCCITGGAGFIGTNLAYHLVGRGHAVTVVDDLTTGRRERLPEGIPVHCRDVRRTPELATAMQGADVVVHLAALPRVQFCIEEPQTAHDVNVNGTLSVLEAARNAGVRRVVLASSSAVYGDREELPHTEAMQPQPNSPYGLHKLVAEQYLRLWSDLHGIETVSLRFFNVYGPHLDPEGPYAAVIGRFLELARQGKPLTIVGDGTQTRDFIHVEDVSRAVERAATARSVGRGEVLNIGSGREISIRDLARCISSELEHIEPRLELKHSLADISAAVRHLEWEPKIGLEHGISELKAEWGVPAAA